MEARDTTQTIASLANVTGGPDNREKIVEWMRTAEPHELQDLISRLNHTTERPNHWFDHAAQFRQARNAEINQQSAASLIEQTKQLKKLIQSQVDHSKLLTSQTNILVSETKGVGQLTEVLVKFTKGLFAFTVILAILTGWLVYIDSHRERESLTQSDVQTKANTMWEYIQKNCIAIVALILGVWSAAHAWRQSRKDNARLITITKYYGKMEHDGRGFMVKAVNVGRRPIVLTVLRFQYDNGATGGAVLGHPNGLALKEQEFWESTYEVGDSTLYRPEDDVTAVDFWFEDSQGRKHRVNGSKELLAKLWKK